MSLAERTKWDARYRGASPSFTSSTFLAELDALLPRRGRALDIGGGTGGNALVLARRGLDVTLADISPVGLALALAEAIRTENRLEIVALDLESEAPPEGPWDLILQANYLHRPLFQRYSTLLAPGGLLVVAHPTRTNLERHPKPGPAFLLDDGELPGLVSSLEIVRHDEAWRDDGRFEARLVARRPHADPRHRAQEPRRLRLPLPQGRDRQTRAPPRRASTASSAPTCSSTPSIPRRYSPR